MRRNNRREEKGDGLIEKTVNINRVAKVVKGGRRFNFTALVVVGDGQGRVGVGYGKANEVPEAIRKAGQKARVNMMDVPVLDGTVPHYVIGEYGAVKVVLRPASPGTGVIAGGSVRPILDAAGYTKQEPGALIDTAGRLQTRRDLMDELGKISKVIGREIDEAPHETLLVLDANTGQNAISQARLFAEVTRLTGLVLTKLDGTAKGGVLVGLADEFEIPVKYIGVGEAVDDLQDFEAEAFVDAIFES